MEINVNELNRILEELITLKEKISNKSELNKSIQNLEFYLNLRDYDLTKLQSLLTKNGFSSLSRSHSYILYQINKNLINISKILNKDISLNEIDNSSITFDEAEGLINSRREIFGDLSHKTKIMVTLPSEAQNDKEIIKNLIKNDVALLRINTAHDDSDGWQKMASFIQEENNIQNKNTKIYVDLAGPKIRTGVIKKVFTPFKIGSKYEECRVGLFAYNGIFKTVSNSNRVSFLIDENVYYRAIKKGKLSIVSEGKEVECLVKEDYNNNVFLSIPKKILINEETIIKSGKRESILYNLEKNPEELKVYLGDKIIISYDKIGSLNYEYKGTTYKAMISCTNREIFDYVKKGDSVFIDDGKIEVKIEDISKTNLICEVVVAKEEGSIIKEEKGINFPNSNLEIPAITENDKEAFDSVVKFADLIGLSFAQTEQDVFDLQQMIGDKNIAIVPKIETKKGFNNLKEILKALQKKDKFGIMIARGDLAIEVGFENLPFIQEEIFDICESAHTPIIYATQILESKMKKNVPSRAEVIDVSVASRADCVMLNKGPFIISTIHILNNILHKMHKMFKKNRQLMIKKEKI